MDGIGGSTAKQAEVTMPPGLVWAVVDPLSFFFISFFFSDKNMNAKKSLDQFDF
jgi:hypothetical protein